MTSIHLTAKQMAGQRLMVGFDGTDLNKQLKFLIDTIKVGGIILFSRNIESPDQLTQLCQSAQQYARDQGQPPLFIGIDQEGGQVSRLPEPFTQFAGNPQMKGVEDASHFAKITANELSSVGINMNMAPVLDVAPTDIESIMAGRAFGHDPEWVASLGVSVIEQLQQNNVMAVAKHFPGIGRTVLDSHLDLPILCAEQTDLQACDYLPFNAAIDHGVTGIMLSHIRYDCLDLKWPASLSVAIAKDLLRDGLGYSGLVLTDDLDMGAVAKHFGVAEMFAQVLAADVDLALICHFSDKIEVAFSEITRLLESDENLYIKCLQSLDRLLLKKREYIIHDRSDITPIADAV
jgi:beta-N-acetylhexosaminidase